MAYKTVEQKQKEAIQQASQLIRHLGKIRPLRIYGEMLLCFILSYAAFYVALETEFLIVRIIALAIFMIFNYRGLTFIHEVAHLETKVKGFKEIYNLLFGYINTVPAYTHLPHRRHHSKKDYGTMKDPEYEWWTKKSVLYLFRPLVLAFFYPVFLTLRFALYPLVYFVKGQELSKITFKKASTFVMNLNYSRPFTQDEFQMMRREDFICTFVFALKIALMATNYIPWIALGYWYGAMVLTCLMNNYRALVAHRYTYEKKEEQASESYYDQVMDSVSIEGGFLTEIWAPLSLRYHSVHHFFPNLPYYDLARAHAIFKESLPKNHPYFKTVEKSFFSAFRNLFGSCLKEQKKRAKSKAKTKTDGIKILHFD
jgi:fatty acid desaturase